MRKVAKQSTNYTDYARTEKCQTCIMFIPTDGVSRSGIREEPTGECTKVRGDIAPVGHCDLYEAKGKLVD